MLVEAQGKYLLNLDAKLVLLPNCDDSWHVLVRLEAGIWSRVHTCPPSAYALQRFCMERITYVYIIEYIY